MEAIPKRDPCIPRHIGVRSRHEARSPGVSEGRTVLWQWSGWVAAGLAGVGLAWMTVHVVREGIDWAMVGWLVLAIVVAGITIASSPVSLADLLVPLPCLAWRWAPVVSPVRVALGVGVAVAIGWAMLVEHAAGAGRVGWGVGAPWLAGVLLAGLCAWWPNLGRPKWLHRAPWNLQSVAAWLIVAGVAFGVRLVWPGRFPSMVDGDEGAFLRMARDARSGEMANPFATGWFEVPNLYPAAMGWLSHLTGDSLGGFRVLMALIGGVTVLATWRLGRVVVGPDAALAGALILAVMPAHLIFTRTALFHGTDPAALMLGLLFLHRAVRSDRSGDAWLAGVMVGLGWYGYWGARSLPMMVALVLLLTARPVWRVATLGSWAAVGFLATIAPLVVTFWRYPAALSGRWEATSITVTGDWSLNPVQAVSRRVREAAFMPLNDNHVIFYRHDPPVIGWPEALLLVLGVAGLLATLLRMRNWQAAAWLVVPSIVLVGVLGQVDVVELHRFLLVMPVWALVIGVGVVIVARWLATVPVATWSRLPVASATMVGVVGLLVLLNLSWVYSNDRIVANWGGIRTVAEWDLGWRLDDADPPHIVLAGPPFVLAYSSPAFTFEAPTATMSEIIDPMRTVEDVPPLAPDALLVLVPERIDERCVIEAALPDVLGFEVRAGNDELLYMVFGRSPMTGWSLETSPAGTTVELFSADPCGQS